MNIGIIAYGYPPEVMGGAELQVKNLAQELSSKNHKVTVFAGSRLNKIKNENSNLKVIRIRYKDIKILRIFFSQLVSFIPKIKKEASNLNVLICYQVNPPGIIGLFSKLMFNIPLITWVRAESEYKSFLRKFIFTPVLLKYSDKFIVQTAKIKKELIKLYSNKLFFYKKRLEDIQIIPNGINVRNSLLVPYKNRNGILYVGRLHKHKGVKYLIKAMEGTDEKLLIVGKGPEQNHLAQMSRGLDVVFLGELSHKSVFRYMEETKLLILPSIYEGLPNVILEAMSVGTPVISTKTGGIPDILEHGKTGFLADPGNPKQIKNYIKSLLYDKDLWHKMSSNCLLEVKKYSWERVEKEFENVLKDIFKAVY